MDSANKPPQGARKVTKKPTAPRKPKKQRDGLTEPQQHTYMWVAVGVGVAGAIALSVWGLQETLARQQDKVAERGQEALAVEEIQEELGQTIDDIKVNIALIDELRRNTPGESQDLPNTLSDGQISELADLIKEQSEDPPSEFEEIPESSDQSPDEIPHLPE